MGALTRAGRILVLNAGSSSLKFKCFDVSPFSSCIGGLVERIGDTVNSTLVAKSTKNNQVKKWNEQLPIKDHVSAMECIMDFLRDNVSKRINEEVAAVGHRIVHGLDIHEAVLLTDDVIKKVEQASSLAPLHNPPGLQGIAAAQAVFRDVPQVLPAAFTTQQALHPAMYVCRKLAAAF
jgi:acetate kinase